MRDTEISRLEQCTGRQLKELLSLATTNAREGTNWLLEVGDAEQMRDLLAEIRSGTDHSAGALLEAVCSPNTTIDSLAAIKRIAKHWAVDAQSRPQQAAATLLYNLAVASALAYHGQNISTKEPAKILPLYRELAAELADGAMAAIFEKAAAALPSLRLLKAE